MNLPSSLFFKTKKMGKKVDFKFKQKYKFNFYSQNGYSIPKNMIYKTNCCQTEPWSMHYGLSQSELKLKMKIITFFMYYGVKYKLI